ncbi:hypothetical protein COCNU_06G004600 [Cocos nucifera]|uniref:Uncharacterized protein n=1 Tax=Cocos nucifera TaxID=13894 RepID=A0A8K0IAD2_COCNU|nr:hypothetical protein COCNU_06G004600 [Cocos nucifera]
MLSDIEEEVLSQIFSLAPLPLSRFLIEENLFKVGLIPTDLTMNSSDLETLRRMAKKRKISAVVAPKRARTKAVLAQPMVGGSSRAANSSRKEKSMPMKAVKSIWSVALRESIPRPFASSSKRSSDGLKISIRMFGHGSDVSESVSLMKVFSNTEDKRKGIGDYRVARSLLKSLVHHVDHFAEIIREIRCLSKEAEEKAAQANRRTDDAQLSRLKAEDEIRFLRKNVKQLESEPTKAEARVLGERKVGKAQAESAKVEAVEAFHASKEFYNIKMDFASLSYLQGGIDLKEKVRRIFPDLNLDLLESNDEEVEEVQDQKIQMKDVFNPAHDDLIVEDAASIPPPAVIILPDQAEVDKSRALDGV